MIVTIFERVPLDLPKLKEESQSKSCQYIPSYGVVNLRKTDSADTSLQLRTVANSDSEAIQGESHTSQLTELHKWL